MTRTLAPQSEAGGQNAALLYDPAISLQGITGGGGFQTIRIVAQGPFSVPKGTTQTVAEAVVPFTPPTALQTLGGTFSNIVWVSAYELMSADLALSSTTTSGSIQCSVTYSTDAGATFGTINGPQSMPIASTPFAFETGITGFTVFPPSGSSQFIKDVDAVIWRVQAINNSSTQDLTLTNVRILELVLLNAAVP